MDDNADDIDYAAQTRLFPTCQMSHVFRPRSKAAETQAEDATKKVPGRLN